MANPLARQSDITTFVLLTAADGRAAEVARAVGRRFPDLNVMTRAQIAADSRALLTKSFNSTLGTMVLIALGVGTLVIGLSAYTFVSERRREYGALEGIGGRGGMLYRPVSVQALAIVAGGLLAGVLIARLVAGASTPRGRSSSSSPCPRITSCSSWRRSRSGNWPRCPHYMARAPTVNPEALRAAPEHTGDRQFRFGRARQRPSARIRP